MTQGKSSNRTTQGGVTRKASPVGQGDFVVKQGDCISSIAADHGHFWKTIWEDPANSELRSVRQNPNILLPGDRVTIPERRQKTENRATDAQHKFMRRGEPAQLKIQFKIYGKPRANEPYKMRIDQSPHEKHGKLDAEGFLKMSIRGNARSVHIVVGKAENQDVYDLVLGGIDPVSHIRGARQRLRNLGYPCPDGDGEMDDATRLAICAFQEHMGLDISGDLDDSTRKALSAEHLGCAS